MMRASRTPEIMGDAAHVIFTKPSREFTGQFCIDDKVLYDSGVRDFEHYRVDPSVPLMSDFFVPDDDVPPPGVVVTGAALGWRGAEVALGTRSVGVIGGFTEDHGRLVAALAAVIAALLATVTFRPDRAIRVATGAVADAVCAKSLRVRP